MHKHMGGTRSVRSEFNRSTIRFLADWEQKQEGTIRKSGVLVVEYDPARLQHCHINWRGADVWEITAYASFSPGGQLHHGSVLSALRDGDQGMVVGHAPQPFEVPVPSDATGVQVWFRAWNNVDGLCEEWDSRYGNNYVFDVT